MNKPLLIWVLFLSLYWAPSAHAYLDLGSGSYIVQIALGIVFSSLFFIKGLWLKLKAFFAKLGGK